MKRSMQEPTFLILTALAAGPQHGYAIIADAGRISGGVTRLQTGTLYMALDRLSSAGLVECCVDGRRGPCRPGQPGRLLAGLLGQPEAGPGHRGETASRLVIACLSAGFGFTSVILLLIPSAQLSGPVFTLLDILAIAVAIVVTRVPGPAGGWVAALITAALLPGLASTFTSPFVGDLTATVVSLLGTVLVAVLLWPVAIASWKGQVRRA